MYNKYSQTNLQEGSINNISTELATALVQGLSIDEIIRQELQTSINLLLMSELTEFLQYEAYDVSGYNSGNSRNGYYKRTLKTKYGEVILDIPRDRNGEFEQQTIPSYKRRTDDLETTILQLYRTGITTTEIATLIEKLVGMLILKEPFLTSVKRCKNMWMHSISVK